jgi:ABC-type nitrate/sulfonate/bicarbonate transport system permease component
MTLSAVAAFEAVPKGYLKVAQSLGTPRRRIWLHNLLAGAAPAALTMTRLSFLGAWMTVLAGEMAGINSGLGYLVIMGHQMYNMKLVMIGIITIGVIGFVMDRLLHLEAEIARGEFSPEELAAMAEYIGDPASGRH